MLLNIDDRSLVTRPVDKVLDSFAYELEDDIIAHYGEWRGQLRFEQAGEIYVSSPVKFRIENDLSNDRPPQLSDVQSWVSLKRYADSLTEELKQAVANVEAMEDTFKANELGRDAAEKERQSRFEVAESERENGESVRVETFQTNETVRQTTFETNESERNETFNTNETTRQENESVRQQAETQRASAESSRVSAEEQRKIDHANRSSELAGKANKKQEDWITPTLLGGANGNVAYLKDELGFVHLKGRVNNAGDLLTMFVMPPGYRPERNSDFIVFSSSDAKRVRVNNNGNVDNSNSQSFVELSNIIYKAER